VMESAPELKESIDIITPMVEQMRMQLEEVISLASLGLVSEMVSHDMGQVTTRLLEESKKLSKQIKEKDSIDKADVLLLVEYVKTTVSSIRSQLKHLDSSFKYNKEKKERITLSELLMNDEHNFYQEKLDRYGITFRIDAVEDFAVVINKGKLIQVFDNLINNSLYWLRKYGELEMTDNLMIRAFIRKPYVYFEDNGWGIERSVEDSVFDPFVTRKPVGEGRGLGLYIIRNLLNGDGCDVVLDEARNERGQRYRFVLNFASIID